MAVPVVAVGQVEGRQVELVDHVQDEPGEMVLGEPVAQVRGQQEGLVAVAREGSCKPWRILSLRVIRTKRELFLNSVSHNGLMNLLRSRRSATVWDR